MGILYNRDLSTYDYKLVRANTQELLEKRVKEAFREEYQCRGGPFVDSKGWFYQAMEKVEL